MIHKNSVLPIDILWVTVLELEAFHAISFASISAIYPNLCDKYCNDILLVYASKLSFTLNKTTNL